MYLYVHTVTEKKDKKKLHVGICMCDYSFLNFEGSLGVIELQIIFDLHVYMYLHVKIFYMLKLQL